MVIQPVAEASVIEQSKTQNRNRLYYERRMAKPVNALRAKVRAQCRKAIRAGKLVRQPCEGCGAPDVQAHHEDYSRPFDVKWFCRGCHAALHRKSHCARGHALTPDNIRIDDRAGNPDQPQQVGATICDNLLRLIWVPGADAGLLAFGA
jgi:hypothetical protein